MTDDEGTTTVTELLSDITELLADITRRADIIRESRNSGVHDAKSRAALYIAEMALRRIVEDYT